MAPTPHPAARAEAAHARGGPSASGATRRAASARRVGLVLHVEPLEAAVFVNGEPLGLAKELRARGGFVPLARGVHRLRLEAPGYATWRAEVAVGARPERLTVALTPLP